MKETELAEIIIDKLKTDGYEIYSEVIYRSGSKRADIVAVKNNEYTVVETKMSMNLTLLEQSFYWKDKAHYVYILFPSKRKINWFALQMCRDYGIGVYVYKKNGEVKLILESSKCEIPDLPKLYEEQKDSVSGSKGGGYITPFSITKEKLIKHIKNNGEQLLLHSIKEIEHHYSNDNSAKNALKKMINLNVIKELEIFKKGKNIWVKSKTP
mgnify:CR=1 FL=1